ncbi:flavin-containing monooxygenase [Herbiconiux ginsengi]|uniref:Cyclohexanone monooxygenase n=1 Tax=Herbiconiux ginsengi TaxID=381665 RepID=A0A1H3THS0_9MICO|nr:NAD(P)/FAD-dependent oxidoreductase [Herbiconiux ginsengi]SDZ49185.1 cyclohexanone monooxygenase [Herbiconiux ginsengi]
MEHFDAAVIGAGQSGLYTTYRLKVEGLSVVGIDGGAGFGGVWHHNGYPGARIDSDSVDYSLQFSKELYEKWRWHERYSDAPTLQNYHNFVADELGVRDDFRFNTRLEGAVWSSVTQRWHLSTSNGDQIRVQFLIMCTGSLGAPKKLAFAGLERFKGQWAQTAHWPREGVDVEGRKVAVIGTGSSGVQSIPALAQDADQLTVFQRHPHWSIPARNRPLGSAEQDAVASTLGDAVRMSYRDFLPVDAATVDALALNQPGSPRAFASGEAARPASSYTPAQRRDVLEKQWEFGGHGLTYVFSDTTTNLESNQYVTDFIREMTIERIGDSRLAERLTPNYPAGTKRLILDIDYYEAYSRDNVDLVSVLETPIVELTETGVRTTAGDHEADLVVFALGFRAFIGPLEDAGIRNEAGTTVADVWSNGPRTLFGLMTPGFPNMFHVTNAGSPSVLGNAMLLAEFLGDWIAECITHVRSQGFSSIEASDAASEEWMHTVDGYAQELYPIRRAENQYMVHVNDDGSRFFQPFSGGMKEYVLHVHRATEQGYAGFTLT